MLKTNVTLICDDCGKTEKMECAYMPLRGFETGGNWANYMYSTHVKCMDCHRAKKAIFKEKQLKMNWFKRTFGLGNWRLEQEFFGNG